jgi:hypothetical protein
VRHEPECAENPDMFAQNAKRAGSKTLLVALLLMFTFTGLVYAWFSVSGYVLTRALIQM